MHDAQPRHAAVLVLDERTRLDDPRLGQHRQAQAHLNLLPGVAQHGDTTLPRRARLRLLEVHHRGIGCGQIDIVVVYKIDRLTRSLADFSKMVEVFERHGVSFVSVTQQFNTTSMGRLMLNVLLSFA